jgi:hypothetical protein
MKKGLLLLSVVGLALGMASCKSKIDPYEVVWGSLEPTLTPYVVDVYGTRLYSEKGYNPLPILDTDQRQLIQLGYTYPEGTVRPIGEGKSMNIRLEGYQIYETKEPKAIGVSTYDDPILILNGEFANDALGLICNLLHFSPQAEFYTANKPQDSEVSLWDFEVEVASEIVADTINMYLKFSNDRAENESPAGEAHSIFAVDLDRVSSLVDNLDESKTYVIKMHYDAYLADKDGDVDKTVITQRSVYCNWTPNKPYIEEF